MKNENLSRIPKELKIACAVASCENIATWREVAVIHPHGMGSALAFYYRCEEHKHGIKEREG